MTLTTNITLSETSTRRAGPVPELPELPDGAAELFRPVVHLLASYSERQVTFPDLTDAGEALLDRLVEDGLAVRHDRRLQEDDQVVTRRSWSLTPLGVAVVLQAFMDGKIARGDI